MKAMWCIGMVVAVAAVASAQTVTLTLDSSQDGQTISSGTTVDWAVNVAVSTGDNVGLALVAVDLVQDAGNPEKFDIPPGLEGSIDTTMDDFSRPLGISNPGEGGATTGYIGVQRGTTGEMNLIQIGGSQNTFGASGSGIGTDFNVDGGVGQSGAQLVVSGSFSAPATDGTYTFSLANGIANVLTSVETPPNFSPVTAATVDISGGSFSFTVQAPGNDCQGDFDCDFDRDFDDINYLVAALGPDGETNWTNYHISQNGVAPSCSYAGSCLPNGDPGGVGYTTFDDINPFIALLNVPCP